MVRLMRDLVGETLSNRYRLVARIAGGGMGEVYRAHDLLLDRAVAVKVLQPSLAQEPEFVARFRSEARAAARLNHPNIVSVYDWGSQDEQTYYMVMEYVSGTDLRDVLISRTVLDPGHAAQVLASVCDALAAAHAAGLVHRDVKPENVLIARDGTVKVADFGVAAMVDVDAGSWGDVPGTLRYLSPEQAGGEEATSASDVWAAGAVLSEVLTGRAGLRGSGADILVRRATDAPETPSSVDRSAPRVFDSIVLKACALDPNHRYADASDMARDIRLKAAKYIDRAPPLESLLEDITIDVRPPDAQPTAFIGRGQRRNMFGRRWNPRLVALLVGIVLIAGVGATRAVGSLTGPEMVDVPTLVGLTKSEATNVAEEAGLVLSVERRRDPDVPQGEVIEQSPARGELEEGSRVAIVVSAGPPLVLVPNLVGMNVTDAGPRLRAFHLELGEVGRRYALEEPGTVISQVPSSGRLEWGETVALVVSKGPRPITIPPVVGKSADEAKAILRDAGFAVTFTNTYSEEVPQGEVVSTAPAAGATAPEGSQIEVVVSLGPKFRELKMPDVRGWYLDEAQAKLESLGLRVKIVQSCGGGGSIVADTQPLPGTTVRENDLVDVFTC